MYTERDHFRYSMLFRYLSGFENGNNISGEVPFYAGLLDHILADEGIRIGRLGEVEGALRRVFSGRKVLEIGCRNGEFLRILKKHGAIVAGTTDPKNIAIAENKLGASPVLAVSKAEAIGKIRGLRDFKPDFILNMNLFDVQRWGVFENDVPFKKIYVAARKVSTEKTKFYIAPSVDTTSVLKFEDLNRQKGITDLQQIINPHRRSEWQEISFRFRIHRDKPKAPAPRSRSY